MARGGSHMIRSQHIDVALYGEESDGLSLQNNLTNICHRIIFPLIDDALSSCDNHDDYLFIDHLEVDLGNFHLDHLESGLRNDLKDKLTSEIRKKIIQPNQHDPIKDSTMIKSEQQWNINLFTFFLEYGYFPWQYKIVSGEF